MYVHIFGTYTIRLLGVEMEGWCLDNYSLIRSEATTTHYFVHRPSICQHVRPFVKTVFDIFVTNER